MVACRHVRLGERAWCLRQLILQKELACRNCGSGSFIIKGVQWRMINPPALDVDLNCASCGTGDTISLSLERPGVAALRIPTKAYAETIRIREGQMQDFV